MRQGERSSQTLLGVVVLLILGGAAAGVWASFVKPAGKKTFAATVGTVRSSVSEAILLAQQAQAGRVPSSYFHTELELLSRDVESAASSLRSARPELDLRASYDAAAQLAARASTLLRSATREADPATLQPAWTSLLEIRAFLIALEEMEEP